MKIVVCKTIVCNQRSVVRFWYWAVIFLLVSWWIKWMALSWASYQIRKFAGCACAGNAGNVFPRCRFQRKPQVSDSGMHHGTCVTHVPWCMSGSLTCGDGESVPGIPTACAPAILRIWQEAHGIVCYRNLNRFYIARERWVVKFDTEKLIFRMTWFQKSGVMNSILTLPPEDSIVHVS